MSPSVLVIGQKCIDERIVRIGITQRLSKVLKYTVVSNIWGVDFRLFWRLLWTPGGILRGECGGDWRCD